MKTRSRLQNCIRVKRALTVVSAHLSEKFGYKVTHITCLYVHPISALLNMEMQFNDDPSVVLMRHSQPKNYIFMKRKFNFT